MVYLALFSYVYHKNQRNVSKYIPLYTIPMDPSWETQGPSVIAEVYRDDMTTTSIKERGWKHNKSHKHQDEDMSCGLGTHHSSMFNA